MALQEGPFGGYTDVTGVINATAAAELIVEINKLLALLPNSSTNEQAATPDFDAIRPELETQIRVEAAALLAAIAAAPTA